jgi:hypothetical protein
VSDAGTCNVFVLYESGIVDDDEIIVLSTGLMGHEANRILSSPYIYSGNDLDLCVAAMKGSPIRPIYALVYN